MRGGAGRRQAAAAVRGGPPLSYRAAVRVVSAVHAQVHLTSGRKSVKADASVAAGHEARSAAIPREQQP